MASAREKRNALKDIVTDAEKQIDDLYEKEKAEEMAANLKLYYDALIGVGFSEGQAWGIMSIIVSAGGKK